MFPLAGASDAGDSIEQVQNLLLRGDRLGAVEKAVSIGDFATALLVASMCDPDTYKRVAQKYAESTFVMGSPMYTTALLFSGSLQAPSGRLSGNWGVEPDELRRTWKSHLAAIISNRTVGWDKVVLSLGDRLNEIGDIQEAHFCFMVCGCPISSPTDHETRTALLGCDHSDQSNLVLATKESLVAFERTEAYEWAKRQGNKNASFKSFQPFKLVYAMLLSDLGDPDQANQFIDTIRLTAVHKDDVQSATVSQIFKDDDVFFAAMEETKRRIRSKDTSQGTYSESFLNGESLRIRRPTTKMPGRRETPLTTTPFSANVNPPSPGPAGQDADATFISAKSNLMDVTGYSMDSPDSLKTSQRKGPLKTMSPLNEAPTSSSSTPFVSNKGAQRKPMNTAAPNAEKPPSNPFIPQPAANETSTEATKVSPPVPPTAKDSQPYTPATAISTPQERKKPKSPPNTAPPVMMGAKKKDKPSRTPAPSSGSGGFSSFKSWIIKKMNPDATECHLPDSEEQAYFDKERERKFFLLFSLTKPVY